MYALTLWTEGFAAVLQVQAEHFGDLVDAAAIRVPRHADRKIEKVSQGRPHPLIFGRD
jgi:hypothetical protein